MNLYKIKVGRKLILAYCKNKPTITKISETELRGEHFDTMFIDEVIKVDWKNTPTQK